jgi:hypothetical protein
MSTSDREARFVEPLPCVWTRCLFVQFVVCNRASIALETTHMAHRRLAPGAGTPMMAVRVLLPHGRVLESRLYFLIEPRAVARRAVNVL